MTGASSASLKRTAAKLLLCLIPWFAAGAAGAAEVDLRLFAHRPISQVVIQAPGWEAVDAAGHGIEAASCVATFTGAHRGLRCGDRELTAAPIQFHATERAEASVPWSGAKTFSMVVEGEQRVYPGRLQLVLENKNLSPILRLDLEDYLVGVTAAESAGNEPEALKALAICARSFAVYQLRQSGRPLNDDTSSQSFPGLPDGARGPLIKNLILQTAGRGLWAGGRPAPAFYHACCGGRTRSAREVWPEIGDRPHLQGVSDVDAEGRLWCRDNRWFNWTSAVPRGQWTDFLRREYGAREARRANDESPVFLIGGPHARRLDPWRFRLSLGRRLGWNIAPSDRFIFQETETQIGLTGRGFGHRVGLCQAGAEAQAAAGRKAEEILAFYFPGAELK